jgi:hypothetical protein
METDGVLVQGCRVVTQFQYSTNYLESRIDASGIKISAKLVEMEDADFNKHTPAVIYHHLRTHKNMWQKCVLTHLLQLRPCLPLWDSSIDFARTGKRFVDSFSDVVVQL